MKARKKKKLENRKAAQVKELQKMKEVAAKEEEKKEILEKVKEDSKEEPKDGIAEDEFQKRMSRHYDELKWLYCELYPGQQWAFDDLCKNLENIYRYRKEDLNHG